MTLFHWQAALGHLLVIAKVGLNLRALNEAQFLQFCQSKYPKMSIPAPLKELLDAAKELPASEQIIFPSRLSLCLLIAACYQGAESQELFRAWLLLIQFQYKKGLSRQSQEEDIYRLSKKYLQRENLWLVKFEVIYFLKEISKLMDAQLQKMAEAVTAFLDQYLLSHNPLYLIKNSSVKLIVDIVSCLFIKLLYECLQQN